MTVCGDRGAVKRLLALDAGAIERQARERIAEFAIRAPGPETAARALSGGNQQKLEEALLVADRIGVMCRGRLVGLVRREDVDLPRLGVMMAGALEEAPDSTALYGVRPR